MRYSLRTLLIVMTFCCLYAAWFGYLLNKANYHRRESNRITAQLALRAGWEIKEMNTLISNIASHSHGRVDSLKFESSGVEVPLDDAVMADHREAVNHRILANAYSQAMTRPWKISDTNFSP